MRSRCGLSGGDGGLWCRAGCAFPTAATGSGSDCPARNFGATTAWAACADATFGRAYTKNGGSGRACRRRGCTCRYTACQGGGATCRVRCENWRGLTAAFGSRFWRSGHSYYF